MNADLRKHKSIIRDFMRKHYSDDRLVMLLDHARSGKLSYWSCSCFIGMLTVDHEPVGYREYCNPDGSIGVSGNYEHYSASCEIPGAWDASLNRRERRNESALSRRT